MGYLAVFILGFALGAMVVVIHAHQPRGFKANNGKRYRLTEVN